MHFPVWSGNEAPIDALEKLHISKNEKIAMEQVKIEGKRDRIFRYQECYPDWIGIWRSVCESGNITEKS